MNIVEELRKEEVNLNQQLKRIRGAISALNGRGAVAELPNSIEDSNGAKGRRVMSAAVRAKIAKSARVRWAKIRAEKSKNSK